MKNQAKKVILAAAVVGAVTALTGCGEEKSVGIDPKVHTDGLFAVMKADRTNYTKLIIQRLGPKGANAILPKEEWKDIENGAPLPAQMFRAGSEHGDELVDFWTSDVSNMASNSVPEDPGGCILRQFS